MIDDVQPAVDAPRCKCGEGLLTPELYQVYGKTRPADIHQGPLVDSGYAMMLCSASGRSVEVGKSRMLQAWWSVGAYEQQQWMEREGRMSPGARPTNLVVSPGSLQQALENAIEESGRAQREFEAGTAYDWCEITSCDACPSVVANNGKDGLPQVWCTVSTEHFLLTGFDLESERSPLCPMAGTLLSWPDVEPTPESVEFDKARWLSALDQKCHNCPTCREVPCGGCQQPQTAKEGT